MTIKEAQRLLKVGDKVLEKMNGGFYVRHTFGGLEKIGGRWYVACETGTGLTRYVRPDRVLAEA